MLTWQNIMNQTNHEPGTVLEFGGDKEVRIAEDGTTRVAGSIN